MKAKQKGTEQTFNPVTIEITFETELEMKDFRSMLVYLPVADVFRRLNLDREEIVSAIPCDRYDDWGNFVKRAKGER